MPKRICAALLLAAVLLSHPSTAKEGDWGLVEINYVKASLPGKWSVQSRSQLTWRDDFDEFYFWFIDAGLAYSLTPAWRTELYYRHAYWLVADEWEQERRPTAAIDWTGKLKGIRLNNLSRLEFRDYQWDKQEDFRFRNRTVAEFPWEILPGGIKPYLEEELFYGFNNETVEINTLTGGVYCKPKPKLKVKAGYRWTAIRTGRDLKWENRNQLVTGIALFF